MKLYMNKHISVVRQLNVHVTYREQQAMLALLVITGNGPTLLSRNWLRDICLDWSFIHAVVGPSAAPVQAHRQVWKLFAEELSTITGYATLELHTDARLKKKFHGARLICFAMKPVIDNELDKFEESLKKYPTVAGQPR